jgi:hypothetical protein
MTCRTSRRHIERTLPHGGRIKRSALPAPQGDQRLAEARCGLAGMDPLSQPVSEHGVQTARRSAGSAIDAAHAVSADVRTYSGPI